MSRRILIVDDDDLIRDFLRDALEAQGYIVFQAEGVEAAARIFSTESCDAVIVDYDLPDGTALDLIPRLKAVDSGLPVIVLTGYGSIDLAVKAIKMGAEQFLTKPVKADVILGVLDRAARNQRSRSRNLAETITKERFRRDPFLGKSAAVTKLREESQKILGTDRPILIQGETGTGKGVLAGWLHKQGPRGEEAMVDLNCAGLSRELLDSELFGHEKGAFTGAVNQKIGLFEVANRGTVFLDEMGDLDMVIQPKLLKVVEDKRFRRLGGVNDRLVDVHLITATNRDLRVMVAQGKFREDLYFRVSCLPLHIPPLRERREDIPLLAEFFIERLRNDLGKPSLFLSTDALSALQSYGWPGNIRELRNVLERAALLSGNDSISVQNLGIPLGSVRRVDFGPPAQDLTLEELERRHILAVLSRENGSVERTAVRLGIPRSTLYAKLKHHGVKADAARRNYQQAVGEE